MSDLYVVAYDDSPASQKALDFAIERARPTGASLLIAHVLEWSPYSFLTPTELEERHKRRTEEMDRAKTALLDPVVVATRKKGIEVEAVIRYGNVADTLIDIAEKKNANQIILGRTGAAGVAARVFGSVASSLAQASPVACTIVP
ncbi:universal stress protein [Maritimibacter sp. 55A14]|uniref:universal stress protein n=1 Tax=Maritimibacter sp. 55A14 TaxID=2174844 RepID=UPI000D60AA5A|nr:universal stress protein [Maritimibacter sp. 55A14]PWE33185.1 universal stress protein [Maritimibacter sp. 55A14]